MLRSKQDGFITMIVMILIILAAVIFLAYMRVKTAQQG